MNSLGTTPLAAEPWPRRAAGVFRRRMRRNLSVRPHHTGSRLLPTRYPLPATRYSLRTYIICNNNIEQTSSTNILTKIRLFYEYLLTCLAPGGRQRRRRSVAYQDSTPLPRPSVMAFFKTAGRCASGPRSRPGRRWLRRAARPPTSRRPRLRTPPNRSEGPRSVWVLL